MLMSRLREKSTSIHNINSDNGLSKACQFIYFLANWLNNSFPLLVPEDSMEIRDFRAADLDRRWPRLEPKSSPSRRLCDLFWLSLPWPAIAGELQQIHILDAGCGDGGYGTRLLGYSNGGIASYTGVDYRPHQNWRLLESQPLFKFHQSPAGEIPPHIAHGTNFFMSQSAIEHFEEDLFYFEQIKKYILSYKKSVLQIHLFPSGSCLWLYGLYGVRQYTPRTVSEITRLFSDFSYAVLYRLGGKACNRLHWEFITKPFFQKRQDFRELKTEEY